MISAPHLWKVQKATAADYDIIVSLTEAAYRDWTILLGHPPLPVTEDYIPRIAAGEVFLLLMENTVCGLVVTEIGSGYIEIFSIVVAPDYQGHGAGKFLLDWVEDRARVSGLSEIRLYTNARMQRNIAMYKRLGFQETGRRENPLRPGWVAVDMAKTVASDRRNLGE